MSCPNEALGLTDTPRWPIFDNSPVDYRLRAATTGPEPARVAAEHGPEEPGAERVLGLAARPLGPALGRVLARAQGARLGLGPGPGFEEPLPPARRAVEEPPRSARRDYFRDARTPPTSCASAADGVDIFGHVGEDGLSPRDDERKAVTEPSEAEPEEAEERGRRRYAAVRRRGGGRPALWQRSPKEVWKELRKHGWKRPTAP
ncbi:hypothetical protein JL721_13090 [Aureococcus anophagefferens]|nr:hypothetical protein JL721_13090 [Aureococcus anophagefferens]